MVSPLASKPSGISVDAWLADISKRANLNPHIAEQKLSVNGLPALRVRYRHPDGDSEEVYVISGSQTFSIAFGGAPRTPGTPLEKLPSYATYLKMLESFRHTPG